MIWSKVKNAKMNKRIKFYDFNPTKKDRNQIFDRFSWIKKIRSKGPKVSINFYYLNDLFYGEALVTYPNSSFVCRSTHRQLFLSAEKLDNDIREKMNHCQTQIMEADSLEWAQQFA